jgi:hypothetical protein
LKSRCSGTAVLLVVVFSSPLVGAAQSVAPSAPSALSAPSAPSAPEVLPIVRDVTRFDAWSFFAPPPGGGDPTYSLLSNRATLGVRVNGARLEVQGAFQYSQIFGLPRRASGPGPLGPGALYYDAARAPAAYQLFFKLLTIRVKDVAPGLSIQAGRMSFASGAEASSTFSLSPALLPSPLSSVDSLAVLKRDRAMSRLVGEVEWSTFGRAFDGVRVDLARSRWHANAALLLPTQGAFEESASATMGSLRVLNASLTGQLATARDPGPARMSHRSEAQVFFLHYRDRREVRARPDNTGLPAAAAAISVATLGASHTGVYHTGPGEIESVIWVARQWGDWYGQRHRATSAMAEGGYRWAARWRPWIRGGFLYASGDDDAADSHHGTFFPMLPTARPAILAGSYAQMNIRDLFAQLRLQPHVRLGIAAEAHHLALAETTDHWYGGTGATAFAGTFFGYTGRVSSQATTLGTLVEISAAAALSRRWTVTASVGTVNGGEVVKRLFAGSRLTVVSLESVFTF